MGRQITRGIFHLAAARFFFASVQPGTSALPQRAYIHSSSAFDVGTCTVLDVAHTRAMQVLLMFKFPLANPQ